MSELSTTQGAKPTIGQVSGTATDYLSDIFFDSTRTKITFTYHLSANPEWQSVIVYEGPMPSWNNYTTARLANEWLTNHSAGRDGTLTFNLSKTVSVGALYTIALFKGTSNDTKWDLGDFHLMYG